MLVKWSPELEQRREMGGGRREAGGGRREAGGGRREAGGRRQMPLPAPTTETGDEICRSCKYLSSYLYECPSNDGLARGGCDWQHMGRVKRH